MRSLPLVSPGAVLPRALLIGLVSSWAAYPARADCTATGRFLYEDRPSVYTNPIDPDVDCFGMLQNRPVRQARVKVVNATTGAVLAETLTDDSGYFSVLVPGTGSANVYVKCFSSKGASTPASPLMRVTNAPISGTPSEYGIQWGPFTRDLSQNFDIGSPVYLHETITGCAIGNPSYGSAFNVYDQLISALDYLQTVGLQPTVGMHMRWKTDGKTGYYPAEGKVDLNCDEGYDDSIILHELGHWVHDLYGGFGEPPEWDHFVHQTNQDPWLAMNEAWGHLFAGLVRNLRGDFEPGYYQNCIACAACSQCTSGIPENPPCSHPLRDAIRYESGGNILSGTFTAVLGGSGSEGAICAALWDLVDTAATYDGNSIDDDPIDGSFLFNGGLTGEQLLWTALQSYFAEMDDPACGSPVTEPQTMEKLWNSIMNANPGHMAELQQVFGTWGTGTWNLGFAHDASEPTDNSAAGATPLPATAGQWSPTHSLYYVPPPPPPPFQPFLSGAGDSDFFSLVTQPSQSVTIETRYPSGYYDQRAQTDSDPYLVIRNSQGVVVAQGDNAPRIDRNASVTFSTGAGGLFTAEVRSIHCYRRTGLYQIRWRQ